MTLKLNGNWICRIDEKLTFCGVLNEYFSVIAERNSWKSPNTRKQYISCYENIILPNIALHDHQSIDQYTREDYNAIIDSITTKGKKSKNRRYMPYDGSTLNKMRHLIYVVVEQASEEGLCHNVLEDTAFVKKDQGESECSIKRSELAVVKKSFDHREEEKIAKLLFENVQCKGEIIGLLLMYGLGLRNAESCAVTFDKFHKDSDDMYLYICQSVKIDSNELKIGGKTKNMARILPVPSRITDFILAREEYVCKSLGEGIDIGALPVVCQGFDLQKHAKADDLTAEAKSLFEKIGINKRVLYYIDKDIENDEAEAVMFEKTPTAYLFRRNFATQLSMLGLDSAEIKYVMGHSIDDPYKTRSDFESKENRSKLREKMNKRAFVNYKDTSQITFSKFTTFDSSVIIPPNSGRSEVVIIPNEAFEELKIEINDEDKTCSLQVSSIPCESGPKRHIDVMEMYNKIYDMKRWDK